MRGQPEPERGPADDLLASAYGPVAAELETVTGRVASLAAAGSPLLREATASLVTHPGKRVRPALLLLSSLAGATSESGPAPERARLVRRSREKVLAAATAFELLHLASLTHDDILDASPLRRGQPTTWARWGTAVALLAGDHLYGKALAQASLAGRRTCRAFCGLVELLVEGQARELEVSGAERPPGRRAYMSLATAKTAAFFAESCALGATLGGAGSGTTRALRRFGRLIGQAYQLADDLLDWQGRPDRTGKPHLGDVRNGRYAFPVVAGLARRPTRVARALARVSATRPGSGVPARLEDLRLELEAAGAFEETARQVRERTRLALACLELLPPGVPRDNLDLLALVLAGRTA
ncbi:MAG: polyprenyl synthetase family protein [Bacillota bacterium]